MGLRPRLNRLERKAEEHFATIRCPECREVFRGAGDLELDVLAAKWAQAVGEEFKVDPAVSRILKHPCTSLEDVVMASFPGLTRTQGGS